VVQLVLVLAAPSTAPNASSAGAFSPYGTTSGTGATAAGGTGTTGVGGTAVGPGGTVAGGTAGAGGASVVAGAHGGQSATGATAAQQTGDTSHCVGGRQFDPAIDYFAPPCVPGIPGAAFANNGATTWQGVSNTQIELVVYVADYGAEVDQILKAQGLYYNANDAKTWNAAYAKFINSHYQLYGRKLHIDTVQGGCRTVPPDYPCLI
jgi:hypothetical protein